MVSKDATVPADVAGANANVRDAEGGQPRKRPAVEAMSPGHMEAIAQHPEASAAKLRTLAPASAGKEARDKVQDADSVLELTRCVRAVEAAAQGQGEFSNELHRIAVAQEEHIKALMARTELLENHVTKIVQENVESAMKTDETVKTVIGFGRSLDSMEAKSGFLVKELEGKFMMDSESQAGKLKTIEETFKTCDAVVAAAVADVEELKARVQTQTPPGIAPARPVTVFRDDGAVNALRDRVDEVARALLDVQEGEVATRLSVQNAEAYANNLSQATSCALEHLKGEAEAREVRLRGDITVAVQELRASSCRCPGNCGGPAPVRDPPGQWTSGPAAAPQRVPLIAAYQGCGGCGGGGAGPPPNPGGGGGGRGPGAQWYNLDDGSDRASPAQWQAGSRTITRYTKALFDVKDAKDNLPKYNGRDRGAMWRKKVTYYLVGRCADIKNLLRWAELQEEEITEEMVRTARYESDTLQMMEADPVTLSYHLWSFLNVSLEGDAWAIYDAVEMENGLEVWRQVNQEVTQRTAAEVMGLEEAATCPSKLQVSRLSEVPQALVSWDAAVRDYLEAGGDALTPAKKVQAILKLLPQEVRIRALWEFDNFKEDPGKLRSWLRTKARLLQSTPGAGAHLFEDTSIYSEETGDDELESLGENPTDGEICAFYRKKLNGPPGAKTWKQPLRQPAPLRREVPPRDVRDVRCANCNKKGHTARDCGEQKRGPQDRVCFECWKPGHVAARCPAKKSGGRPEANSLNDAPARVSLNLLGSEDFVPSHRLKNKTWRAPRAEPVKTRPTGTLGDHMGSVFQQLAAMEAHTAREPLKERKDVPSPPVPVGEPRKRRAAAQSRQARCPGARGCECSSEPQDPSGSSGIPAIRSECRKLDSSDPLRVPKLDSGAARVSPLTSLPAKPKEVPAKGEEETSHGTMAMFIEAPNQELNALPEAEEPEFIEVEMTLDTGATVHAADRVDLPGHTVEESPGSRVGQKFQGAGGKFIDNEGQTMVAMLAPESAVELDCCFQIAKVTRPLLSVTKITEKGIVEVVCKKDMAQLVEAKTRRVLATFHRQNGLYVAMMKVKNPKWSGFTRPGL